MKTMILVMLACISSLCAGSKDQRKKAESMAILKDEQVDYYRMQKIRFENHTYIFFSNRWDKVGHTFFHDIDCEFCKGEEDRVLNAWKKDEGE